MNTGAALRRFIRPCFYMDTFENGFLYLKVLIEYFLKIYSFNTIGHTVDEINVFEMSKKMPTKC